MRQRGLWLRPISAGQGISLPQSVEIKLSRDAKPEARLPGHGSRALAPLGTMLAGCTLLLLLHVGFGTPRELFRLQILDMGGDPPMIADGIDHTRAAVSIELVCWLHQ